MASKLASVHEQALSRRTFLVGSAGAGLVVGLGSLLPGCSREQAASDMAAGDMSRSFAPTVWYVVDADGGVLVNIAKAEMGQHVGTALARVVADELGAAWERVTIEYVDSDPKWGYMVTGGSWSVHTTWLQLCQAGAAGRQVLTEAGAALLGVDPSECTASDNEVRAGDRRVSYAEIVQTGDIGRSFSAEELAALPIKEPAERRLIGKPTEARDIPEKSRGEAVYGLDVERPGMVHAQPMLPPTRYGSTIRSIDDSAARDLPGYRQTLEIDDPSGKIQGWAVVVADTFPAAMKAAKAVAIEWQPGPTADVSESAILDEGARLCQDRAEGTLFVNDGDAPAARESAAEVMTSVYRTSTALHFTLEPQNALIEFDDAGICHVHAGNQWQSLIIPDLAKALDMAEENIVLHQYYLGGGFGRRLYGDQMIPAALAARALGRPVKLVFQRADDSRFDCVRSASVQQFDASFDADGQLTGIEHAAAAGWPTLAMAPGFLGDGVDGNGKFDPFSINGADHWYSLANHRVRAINNDVAQQTFLPGWLRAVGPGWIGWGVESFMDEVAERLAMDPIEFRLSRLDAAGRNGGTAPQSVGGAARLAAVLRDVRDRSSWGKELPAGEALGVAVCHGQERNMPTWVACVAHVAVDGENNVTLKKLWQTIDCGTVVHPDGALAQAEGAALWGVSLALHEGATFEQGQVRQRNLDSYLPLRMADVPELDIRFVDSTEMPSGLGEPPLIPVAPAIGNAVYRITGTRPRDLPIRLA